MAVAATTPSSAPGTHFSLAGAKFVHSSTTTMVMMPRKAAWWWVLPSIGITPL